MIKRSAGNDQECGRFQELLGAPFVALEQEVASLKGLLGPGEQLLVRGVDKRRSEFTAGRLLARRAFGCFGLEHAELLADPDGVPQWPAGSVGCITHAGGRVAVAVAPRESAEGVGIDMETVARFHGGLEQHVLSQAEIDVQLAATSGAERQSRTAVLFCAKEAWFKCQFPLARRRLGFHDAEVHVDWSSGRFAVLPRAASRGDAGVSGCSAVQGGIARAAIALRAGQLSAPVRSAWQLPGGS